MPTVKSSKQKPKIGIDLMGSDNAPEILLEHIFEHDFSACLIVIGTDHVQKKFNNLQKQKKSSKNIEFVRAKDSISMDEDFLLAIRHKKEASLFVGMRLLKDGKIDAFVSAGNTGALMSSAKVLLSMFPNIHRPALLALMPTEKNPLAVLDVGANINYKTEHLIQYAHMGTTYQRTRGIKTPKVGLLNIGTEAKKGTVELREVYQELKKISEKSRFKFLGNVEGKEVFKGNVDVLVTDGFTGNIFLKTAEGIASLVLDRLKKNIPKKDFESLEKYLNDLQKHLHYAEYPGALLCGVRGIVIKCHGYSTPQAFMNGIKGAIQMSQEKLIKAFQSEL